MNESSGASLTQTLDACEEVVRLLAQRHVDAVLIGAMALAVHGYPRATEDVDLAVSADPRELAALTETLRQRGWQAEFREPDPQDPLGGVIDIHPPGADLVQVVNFSNPPSGGFPRLVREALQYATRLTPDRTLLVTDLGTLIAFKLYAGGPKSRLDILELIDRNPSLDLAALRERCESLNLARELDDVLATTSG